MYQTAVPIGEEKLLMIWREGEGWRKGGREGRERERE